jgi:hypothetical protein
MGVAQAVDMVGVARNNLVQERILWDAGFSTPEEVDAAERVLSESYFMAAATVGLSVGFAVGDFNQLARASMLVAR